MESIYRGWLGNAYISRLIAWKQAIEQAAALPMIWTALTPVRFNYNAGQWYSSQEGDGLDKYRNTPLLQAIVQTQNSDA